VTSREEGGHTLVTCSFSQQLTTSPCPIVRQILTAAPWLLVPQLRPSANRHLRHKLAPSMADVDKVLTSPIVPPNPRSPVLLHSLRAQACVLYSPLLLPFASLPSFRIGLPQPRQYLFTSGPAQQSLVSLSIHSRTFSQPPFSMPLSGYELGNAESLTPRNCGCVTGRLLRLGRS
jgi:hypothetical protein